MASYDNAAQALGTLSKNVTTAGTRVQLTTTPTSCLWALITARPANTGKIAVGGTTVVAAAASEQGAILSSGQSVTIPINNLTDVYLDATVNGEGVAVCYGTR